MMEILDPSCGMTVGELLALVEALAPNSPRRLAQQRVLRDAHRKHHTVWVDYQSTSDPNEGLIQREVEVWFLKLPRVQGLCRLRGAERIFRLERMRTVRAGEDEYELPRGLKKRI